MFMYIYIYICECVYIYLYFLVDYLVVQPTDRVYFGYAFAWPTKNFGSTGVAVALVGPSNISAFRNTGNVN